MIHFPEGNAIVYCQGAFNTTNGKTAHGLVRRTRRYRILAVVDSKYAGHDAGLVLDNKPANIPIFPDIQTAIKVSKLAAHPATHLVIGLAPDGGRLNAIARQDVMLAIQAGLNVDCGLHDFLSEDQEMSQLAAQHHVQLRDIRKPPDRKYLHFFSGKIEQVKALKIAVLGTDSAIGKRTTAWILTDAFNAAGIQTEMVGTGQTAWMQGARYSLILDSLVNDFLSGEIEHAVWSAWDELKPQVIVIEGQGSLMNPAYPGGYEILAAGRPDIVLLQHAPARVEYDGFPGYKLHALSQQIQAIEMISGKPVVAITINHENLSPGEVKSACEQIEHHTGKPAIDVLLEGGEKLATFLKKYLS
ncbi:DUF1611 domain-containing protein [candidate division KSB1 bacterium]|nr:DUF1611 domain-containing protein [candidate division KSB1 bacterium]